MEVTVAGQRVRIDTRRVEGDIEDKLERYLDGETVAFDATIELDELSPFAQQVLDAVRDIPYGETRTYGEIAATIGSREAVRAVAQACAMNPVPIVVPCHRVVAADGIGGYQFGEDAKRALLELEGAR